MEIPSHSYGVSLAVWDHSVTATRIVGSMGSDALVIKYVRRSTKIMFTIPTSLCHYEIILACQQYGFISKLNFEFQTY